FIATCNGQTKCANPNGQSGSPNTCGGGAAATQALRVRAPEVVEETIVQCCPPAGTQTQNWFAIKQCPVGFPVGQQVTTTCGTVAVGSCIGCPGYPDGGLGGWCDAVWDSQKQAAAYCADDSASNTTCNTCSACGSGSQTWFANIQDRLNF